MRVYSVLIIVFCNMKLLKEFKVPETWNWWKKKVRESCRAVVFDDKGLIPIIFMSKKNYHKLPGGWVEWSEDKIETLKRELLEEAWCNIEVTKEMWIVSEWNSTEENISYCYVWKVLNKWFEKNLTTEEIERWLELKRMNIDEAISTLEKDMPNDPYGYRILERDLFILLQAKEGLTN